MASGGRAKGPSKAMAITSLVCGLVALPTAGLLGIGALVGLGTGIAALVKIDRDPRRFAGVELALAGILTSLLSLLATVPLALFVSGASRVGAFDWLTEEPSLPDVATPLWTTSAPVPLPPPPPPPPPPPGGADGSSSLGPSEALRVGGPVVEPTRTKRVSPRYPPEAAEARLQGVVILECTISPGGKVQEVRVVSGDPLLAQAAREAVSQWEYTPTLLDGVPVPVIMTVTVNFRL